VTCYEITMKVIHDSWFTGTCFIDENSPFIE